MTSPESDAEIDIRGTQIEALEAFVLREPTQAKLLKPDYRALLDMVVESPSANELSDTRRAKILYDAFGAAVARAHTEAPKDGKSTKLTPSETDATYVAAGGELLGLSSDNELLARCGKDRYEKCLADGEKATDLGRRKFRAVAWVGLGSTKSAERHARDEWWPAFLAAVERHLEQRPDNAPPKTVAAPAQKLAVEEPVADQTPSADDSQKQSIKYRLRLATADLIFTIKTLASFALIIAPFQLVTYMPTTTAWYLKLADTGAPWATAICFALWSIPADVIVTWRTRPHYFFSKRVRWGSAAIGSLIMYLVVYGHFEDYKAGTAYARSVEAFAQKGNVIFTSEFNEDGSCPQERPALDASNHLAVCATINGNLRATMSVPNYVGIGIYPSNPAFQLGQGIAPPATTAFASYYIETRFRTEGGTPLSACGITLQATTGSGSDRSSAFYFLFHLRQVGQIGGHSYVSEVLSPFYGQQIVTHPSQKTTGLQSWPIPPGKNAVSSIGVRSFPGWSNGSWTKLGLLVVGQKHDAPHGADNIVTTATFLVNDRVVSVDSIDIPADNQASVGVMAGSLQSGGTATCDFDYVHARQLPS